MRQVRAFVAVPLCSELLREIRRVQRKLAEALPGVRWVRPETMHLTLHFFGQVPEELLEKMGEVMLSIGSLSSPFPLEIAGVGAFPTTARPRVIWLGVRGGEALADLQTRLGSELKQLGLPVEERPFTPHLTLGRSRQRVASAPRVLEEFRDIRCGSMTADRIVLFESRLQPSGAIHLPLKTVELGRNG